MSEYFTQIFMLTIGSISYLFSHGLEMYDLHLSQPGLRLLTLPITSISPQTRKARVASVIYGELKIAHYTISMQPFKVKLNGIHRNTQRVQGNTDHIKIYTCGEFTFFGN